MNSSDEMEPLPVNCTAAAIAKDKHSQYAVKWAVNHLLSSTHFLILIHVKPKNNPSGIDGAMEGNESDPQTIFIPYRGFCARKSVQVREVVLEDTDVAKAILDYINNNNITNIVMGASSRNALKKTFKKPDVPSHVTKYAPEFCSVYVIAKSKLSNLRSAQRPFGNTPSSPKLPSSSLGVTNQLSAEHLPTDDLNTSKIFLDGSSKWAKVTSCCCNPPKVSEIRISDTLTNSGRPYYKCRFCGFFAWMNEDDIVRSAEEIVAEQRIIVIVKETLDEFVKYFRIVVKVAVIMYFVHFAFVVTM